MIPSQHGFTLFEILVVIAIVGLILAFGTVANVSLITGDTLRSEQSTIVSLLEKARSRAMANMRDSSQGHGVCFNNGTYVIFHDRTTCTPTTGTDEVVPANSIIATASNFSTTFPTVMFSRLSGRATVMPSGATIILTDGTTTLRAIDINDEGAINW